MVGAIFVSILYVLGLSALNKISKVKYTDILRSTKNIRNGLLFPVGAGAAALSIYLIITGQFTAVFKAGFAIDASWLWAIPAIILIASIVRLTHAKWQSFEPVGLVYLTIGALLVGYSEELLVRGYVTTRLIDLQYSVLMAALISSILFGVLHFVNYLNGQDIKTTSMQVCTTILFGLDFFYLFGLAGTLIYPMFLHFFHDLSLLVQGGTINQSNGKNKTDKLEAIMMLIALVLPILGLFFIK